MKKPVAKTLIALSMFSATFGAVKVYQTINYSNSRTIASLENPIIAEYASAKFIKEQKVRMEEVTLEMKNANGDMIKVTKRLVEIETKLAAQMEKGVAYSNIAEISKLKNELAKAKSDKVAVEKKMEGLKVKHKESIDSLTKINNKLAKEFLSSEEAKKELAKKISQLEASGKASAEELAKLRSNLEEKNKKSNDLNIALNELKAQVDAKNIALAQAVSANDDLNKSVEELNSSIAKLNESISEKDERIIELDTSLVSLQQDHSDLKSAKEELDQRIAEITLVSEMQEEQIQMKEEEISQKNEEITKRDESILEKDNTISCQQQEIKVNTDKITELQALINDSTKAIKESKDAIKTLKEEKEERVAKIEKLEKENKAFQKEKKEFDYVVQMMMANFMRIPQMFSSFMNQSQMGFTPNYLTNPLTGYGQQIPQMNNGFGGTGMKMYDPYAAPQYITNNYYQQTQPYGGFNNDFSIREMFQPESSRNPSGYYSF